MDRVEDSNLKNKIENFKFSNQYADFKDLKYYKNGNMLSTDNVSSYDAEYRMSNTDKNIKKLREVYPIATKKSPVLKLYTDGDIKGSSVGYESIEYSFSKVKDQETAVRGFVSFGPSDEGAGVY